MQFNFLSNPVFQKVIGGFIAAVLAAFFIYSLKKFKSSGFQIFSKRRQEKGTHEGLIAYRKDLDEKTLRISHPWMKEEQTLDDILVPITFQRGGKSEREELEIHFRRLIQKNPLARMLILGKPGSGKTVAMRVLARITWDLQPEKQLIPVLLDFSQHQRH